MSLPLPRPVGVESDDELLCLRLRRHNEPGQLDEGSAEQYKAQIWCRLSEQLPEGFEVLCVDLTPAGASFQPCSATYTFALPQEHLNRFGESLRNKARILIDSSTLDVNRRVDEKGTIRRLDVRPFLKSIEVNSNGVTAQCRVSPTGSIRVDEIVTLLELDCGQLDGPVRRVSVEWQKTQGRREKEAKKEVI
jgi:hypothetical protein